MKTKRNASILAAAVATLAVLLLAGSIKGTVTQCIINKINNLFTIC